ncbi:Helicase ATP-binding domain-containing protein [Hyphomicrobiales bacterium]|jgi:SNF2 family DNA or RNA helicase|nr:Helicase ATP-binding domain-containing protein [Hyphomicrobiales bacterium]CAH1702907.1 Helicase ATP-binding domain-containing protein [Hyphomicrobiales bacterium]CAI0347094.1 Helicase ATP-binding domain-containing protein [Hyphomicrobiales bacterium]
MTRTYGEAAFNPQARRWELTKVEPHVVGRLKRVFSRIDVARSDAFRFHDEPAQCSELVWFMMRYPMVMSQADRARLEKRDREFEALKDACEQILLPDWKPGPLTGLKEGVEIRRYQSKAMSLLGIKKGLLLGDDVGLGKTHPAMAFLATHPGALPAAVVVEPNLVRQWKRRIEETTHLRVHVVDSTKPYSLPTDCDVVIFRYSNILGWGPVAKEGVFKTVIYDEIQSLRRGRESSKGQACWEFSKKAEYRMGLSATPVFGYGIEIFNIISFLFPNDKPLGTREEFVREWCSGGDQKVRDPDALGAFLRENHLMLRRTKADEEVRAELAYALVGDRINRVPIEVPYDEGEEKRVEALARTLAIKTVSGSFMERGKAARDLDMLLRQSTGVAKAKGVADLVAMLLESGRERVVLAGWHRDVIDIWKRELARFKPVLYTGSEGAKQKNASEDAFVSGDSRVLIISLGSGAGLDSLQACCNTLVVGELPWSRAVTHQLEGRLDRDGQEAEIIDSFVTFCDSGSDPAIMELMGLKAAQAKGISDPYAEVEFVQQDEGRITAMAKAWLQRRGLEIPKPAGPEAGVEERELEVA